MFQQEYGYGKWLPCVHHLWDSIPGANIYDDELCLLICTNQACTFALRSNVYEYPNSAEEEEVSEPAGLS